MRIQKLPKAIKYPLVTVLLLIAGAGISAGVSATGSSNFQAQVPTKTPSNSPAVVNKPTTPPQPRTLGNSTVSNTPTSPTSSYTLPTYTPPPRYVPPTCNEAAKAQIEQQLVSDVNIETARHIAADDSIKVAYEDDTASEIAVLGNEEINHEHLQGVRELKYEADMNAIHCTPHQ